MSDIMTNDQRRLRTRVAVFACIAVAALVLDQITKAWDRDLHRKHKQTFPALK